MPHLIIEYARDLEQQIPANALLEAAYQGALESQLFTPSDIKVRAIAYDHFLSGEAHQRFVHVNLKLLSGRNTAQKTQLSEQVLEHLKQALTALDIENVSVTVELQDIERNTYSKHVC